MAFKRPVGRPPSAKTLVDRHLGRVPIKSHHVVEHKEPVATGPAGDYVLPNYSGVPHFIRNKDLRFNSLTLDDGATIAGRLNVNQTSTEDNEPATNFTHTGENESTSWFSGNQTARATVKITHNKPTGSDANAAAINATVSGSGTGATCIYADALNGTTGSLLRLRNLSSDVYKVTSGGVVQFGSTADTNLYRGAANQLKTDDSMYVSINLDVDGNSTLKGTVLVEGLLNAKDGFYGEKNMYQGWAAGQTIAAAILNYGGISPIATGQGVTCLRNGSLTGIAANFYVSAHTTNGTLTLAVYKNGVFLASATTGTITGTGAQNLSATFDRGTYTFSRNDAIIMLCIFGGGFAGTVDTTGWFQAQYDAP